MQFGRELLGGGAGADDSAHVVERGREACVNPCASERADLCDQEVGEPIGGVTLGDVDSDGALDILVAVPSGAVAFFRSNP